MPKKWVVAEDAPKEFFEKFPLLPRVIAQILWNRGLRTQEEVDVFLSPDYSRDIHDPFLFRDMEKAIERIFKAIEKKEKIVVHGDYDSDGVCSSSLIMTTLEALGSHSHHIFLPHREKEGYGLSPQSVENFFLDGVQVLITTDCGITNVDSVQKAQSAGIDVIITDHHQIQEKIPEAFAIIHPALPSQNYPWKELAGVGSAFKFSQGLIRRAKEKNMPIQTTRFGEGLTWEGFEKWLLDLVAIATITDMMPLCGENRVLVKYGLLVLNKTKRLGLKELIKLAQGEKNMPLDAWSVGFLIGPRLNATGRMDSSIPSFDILMTLEEEDAKRYAEFLHEANRERQTQTQRIIEEAEELLQGAKNEFLLSVMKPDWHVGVIGLSAGRLVNEYHLPAIVCTEVGGEIRGSGRSIEGFHMTQALEKLEKYLSRFGGHSGACGFTLKDSQDFGAFVKEFEILAQDSLKEKDLTPQILLDGELDLSSIDWDLWENLEKIEPYGIGNPKPYFLLKNVQIQSMRKIGKDGQHVRFTILNGTQQKTVVGFRKAEFLDEVKLGAKISLIVEIQKNVWNGSTELQLVLHDWRVESV